MSVSRLDIRNKCLTVKQNDGCLFIKEQTGQLGYEHLLCVSGDERVLADAFDEYLATDVFNHYVKCRDINVLKNKSNAFTSSDVIGLEFNFIHTDPGESTTLVMTSDNQTTDITAKVTGDASSPVFEFGDDNNTIQFTAAETKRVKIGDYWYQVTFIEFKTAVFTIDRVERFLFPEGSIAVMDELGSELVYQNTDVQHVPTVIAKIDELMGEIVYQHEPIPMQSSIFKVMIDELVGEVVFEDGSLDVIPPYNITVCDVPEPIASIPTACGDAAYYSVDSVNPSSYTVIDLPIEQIQASMTYGGNYTTWNQSAPAHPSSYYVQYIASKWRYAPFNPQMDREQKEPYDLPAAWDYELFNGDHIYKFFIQVVAGNQRAYGRWKLKPGQTLVTDPANLEIKIVSWTSDQPVKWKENWVVHPTSSDVRLVFYSNPEIFYGSQNANPPVGWFGYPSWTNMTRATDEDGNYNPC